jgi:hypothetical protein
MLPVFRIVDLTIITPDAFISASQYCDIDRDINRRPHIIPKYSYLFLFVRPASPRV